VKTEAHSNCVENAPTRRVFSKQIATLLSVLGFSATAFAETAFSGPNSGPNVPHNEDGITHTSEAIHQEVTFNASPARVYDALTDAKQFSRIVQLSAAMRTMSIANKPPEISREPGGDFSAFGGYITGRQIELIPGQRLVQVWRSASWPAGAYSIAHFELSTQGPGTKLVFDHAGFPQGEAEHLAAGWKGNYWEPLTKFLAESR
jgi:activator of HSP90 ATPase